MRGPFRCTPECCWAVVRAWHGWSALRRLPYYECNNRRTPRTTEQTDHAREPTDQKGESGTW